MTLFDFLSKWSLNLYTLISQRWCLDITFSFSITNISPPFIKKTTFPQIHSFVIFCFKLPSCKLCRNLQLLVLTLLINILALIKQTKSSHFGPFTFSWRVRLDVCSTSLSKFLDKVGRVWYWIYKETNFKAFWTHHIANNINCRNTCIVILSFKQA